MSHQSIQEQLEEYVLARQGHMTMPVGFSPSVQDTIPWVDKLFSMYEGVYAEAQLAANVTWKPTEWFGKDTAWRSIWDITGLQPQTCFIGDYKSGKVYPLPNEPGQLHLSAVMGLHRFSDVPEVTSAYIYIEHKKIEPVRVTRLPTTDVDSKGKRVLHLVEVQTYFEGWFDKVQIEKNFDPVVNENCKYCQATRAQCKFSRKL